MTQHQQIIEYLTVHDEISPMEAFSKLHITKLATRVSEMIKDGVPINKRLVRKTMQENGTTKSVTYMAYSLGSRS